MKRNNTAPSPKGVTSALLRATFALCCALCASGALAQSALAAERYVWQPTLDGGAAEIRNPSGGVWAYTAGEPDDGRAHSRFALGKLQRTEYTLFSAEEEAALWKLRQEQLQAHESGRPTQRPYRRHREPLQWPHVVLRGPSACVPAVPFSDAADWQQHLLCWDEEARDVE